MAYAKYIMPDKYYPSISALETKATVNVSQIMPQTKAQLRTLSGSFTTYHAKLRTMRFVYPSVWKLESSISVEEAGIKREQVKLHNTLGGSPLHFTLSEPGTNIYFNPDSHQNDHEIAIVTAKALNIPGWKSAVLYVEIAVQRPDNNTWSMLYGLRSQHPLYDHVHSFTSKQDEVPLLVSEPTQIDPYTGFLVFMNAWWGFKTKADALAILKSPAHKAARSVMMSISFT